MSESSPHVRFIGEPQAIPVFNCRVIVTPHDAAGKVVARAAELPGLCATADSQREALQQLVKSFKAKMAAHMAAGDEIPWVRAGDQPQPGEQEYFVAVHL
jgi:hypothetical protein